MKIERLVLWFILAIACFWLFGAISDWYDIRNTVPKAVVARGSLADDELNTMAIFSSVSPSVVSIATSKRVRDFWRRDVYSVPAGSGSGFIWDDKGHVVTNYHVIKNASSATITLNDNREYQATLVGAHPENDLAVLRIDVQFQSPPAVAIGTSEDIKVGQNVYVIGNPFGLDYTLSRGVVSALDRSITGDDNNYIDHLIQTDAAINPGNSGGPLIDSAGRVIGITTAIYSPSGANAGIGFAIPIDTVNKIITSLIRDGHYKPLNLGIRMDDSVNNMVEKQLGVAGVVVLNIEKNSIAHRAGLISSSVDRRGDFKLGDIIMAINDIPVETSRQLNQLIESLSEVKEWRLQIWRNGRAKTLYYRKST